jgi:hypothetical protein
MSFPRPVLLLCAFMLLLAGCGSDGEHAVTLGLDSDAPCYGFDFAIERADALKSSCEIRPELAALGCEFAFTDGVGSFRAGGCFIPAGTPLFACTAPAGVASRMRAAEVRCGCGCAVVCPSETDLVVCEDGDADCQDVAAAGSLRASESERGSSATALPEVTTTTHPPFCADCCDHIAEIPIQLEHFGPDVREIEFEMSLDQEPDAFCPQIECSRSVFFEGPFRMVKLAENRLRICVTSISGSTGGRPLVYCLVTSGEPAALEFTDIRAVSPDLRPVDVEVVQGPDREL